MRSAWYAIESVSDVGADASTAAGDRPAPPRCSAGGRLAGEHEGVTFELGELTITLDAPQVRRERDVLGGEHHHHHAEEGGQQPPPHARARGRLEPEADPADGLDPAMVAELLAQGGDVGVDGLGRSEPVDVPHPLEDLGAGEHRAGVVGEVGEDVELLGGERQLGAVDVHPPGAAVDLQRADRRARRRCPRRVRRTGRRAGRRRRRRGCGPSSSRLLNGLVT